MPKVRCPKCEGNRFYRGLGYIKTECLDCDMKGWINVETHSPIKKIKKEENDAVSKKAQA